VTVHRSETPELWQDPSVPTADRVAALIAQLTTAEKLAQLQGLWVGMNSAGGDVAPHQHEFAGEPVSWEEAIRDGLGQLTRPFGTAPVDPAVGARSLARSQRQVMEANRFGIPALVHEECLTGFAAWQASVFPSPLCWGASFDPELVERMTARMGATMRSVGVHQGLSPVLDVARDLRWGRVEETISEDPYLVGTIGSAYVRGLESAGIVSTLKHFVGYSASRAGRNLAPVSIGRREIADVLLPPFEMALRAGARSVMNSYADIDGVPVAADGTVLTGLLRDTYGFDGTVVADYFSVSFLHTLHRVAGTLGEAAALALAAGIDVELPTVNCYGQPLLDALQDGTADIAWVDRALERVLRQKCELGLLDAGYSPDAHLPRTEIELDPADSRAVARELAERSIVLLRNADGALPLTGGRRVAVVGPRAHEPGAMMGCYSFPMHVGVHHPEVPLGLHVPTLFEALKADPAGYQLSFAEGCPVLGGSDAGIAEAVGVAEQADVCIAVLGDKAGLFGGGTSGEGSDASDLRLPGRQEELLEALLATGTPVVLVLLVGRPYELSRQLDRLAAVVCGFYPGEEGGAALAAVLSGRVNPAGRLPVSFPAENANQPATNLSSTLAGRSDVSNIDPTALFAFGHGLSYAPAAWDDISLAGDTWPTDGTCTLAATLSNPGDRATSEVVQVYLSDPVAEVARPVHQLIAAPRVDLEPGQRRTVTITLHADLTSYTGRAGQRQVDSGRVELRVGASSTDIRACLGLDMVGSRRVVGFDRVLQPEVTISTS
jgi:beta-xylosidase